jgi:carbonic anhydrase
VADGPEEPLDRLHRRLAQVLGVKAAVDAARGGEWRLVTRASTTTAPTGYTPLPPAQPMSHERRAQPAGSARHPDSTPHWAYEGRTGPQAWGGLKPDYGTCASGQRQSPIDIRDGLALQLEPLHFDYRPSSFGVIDNGHTVQVNVAPGNAIDIDGRRFELQQFHFHRPSEERVNGRQFDMSVHLVHKDAAGRLAVLALLLERGAAQAQVQTVWNHLPLEKGEEAPARVAIDLNALLPAQRGYYTYMGSLTTPPCSEGVQWVVMQQPVQVSATQIDIFSRLYPMNARPIQQAAGRMIKQSE